jgi:hypothetical protein
VTDQEIQHQRRSGEPERHEDAGQAAGQAAPSIKPLGNHVVRGERQDALPPEPQREERQQNHDKSGRRCSQA